MDQPLNFKMKCPYCGGDQFCDLDNSGNHEFLECAVCLMEMPKSDLIAGNIEDMRNAAREEAKRLLAKEFKKHRFNFKIK